MISKEAICEEIFRQTQIEGNPGYEGRILHYIFEKLKRLKNVKLLERNDNYGICCIISPKKEVKRTVLLESHVDIVRKRLIQPSITNLSGVEAIEATALDDRVHSSIILKILECYRFEHTQVIGLFCVGEEDGFKGSKWFCKNASTILQGISVNEVYVLDACVGRKPNGNFHPKFKSYGGSVYDIVNAWFGGEEQKIPIIGKGHCPTFQSFGTKDKDLFHRFTDLSSFVRSSKSYRSKFRNCNKFEMLGLPIVDMHHQNSFCSVSDLMGFIKFLKTFLQEYEDVST